MYKKPDNEIIKREYTTPNDAMLLFGIAIAAFFVAQVVFSFLGNIFFNLSGDEQNASATWFATMGGTLSLGITCVVLAKKRNFSFVKVTNLNKRPNILSVLCALLMLIGILALGIPLANFFVDWLGIKQGVSLPLYGDARDYVFLLIVVCVLPALCEEFFLRGVVATGFSRYGILAASLLSGGLFMIFHMNPAQTVHQFVLGVALAYVMLKGGNLWTCVIVHFFNNFLVLFLSAVMSDELQTKIFNDLWYVTLPVGIALAIVGAILFAKTVGKSRFDKNFETNNSNACPYVEDYLRLDYQTQTEQTAQTKERISAGAVVSIVAGVLVCVALWLLSLPLGN